jgi:hypothetical protein
MLGDKEVSGVEAHSGDWPRHTRGGGGGAGVGAYHTSSGSGLGGQEAREQGKKKEREETNKWVSAIREKSGQGANKWARMAEGH